MTAGTSQKVELQNITGVILAGGRGSRMYPLGMHYPKCILPVLDRPLIEYQINIMKRLGIRDIIIVIGYQGFKIVQLLGSGEKFGVKLKYVDQGTPLGIAHAVGKLENHVKTPFLLFLGDIFFLTNGLEKLLKEFETGRYSSVLATKIEDDPGAIRRNFAIIEGIDGLVQRVIEKPRHTVNKIKGCGLYLFDLRIFDAIRRTPRTAMRDEYEITDAVQILIDDGCPVKQVPVVNNDMNLTYPADLLRLNLELLKEHKTDALISEDSEIASSVKIHKSVIGSGVVLKGAGRVENSIIFPDTEITVSGNLRQSIVTPHDHIYCHDAVC